MSPPEQRGRRLAGRADPQRGAVRCRRGQCRPGRSAVCGAAGPWGLNLRGQGSGIAAEVRRKRRTQARRGCVARWRGAVAWREVRTTMKSNASEGALAPERYCIRPRRMLGTTYSPQARHRPSRTFGRHGICEPSGPACSENESEIPGREQRKRKRDPWSRAAACGGSRRREGGGAGPTHVIRTFGRKRRPPKDELVPGTREERGCSDSSERIGAPVRLRRCADRRASEASSG